MPFKIKKSMVPKSYDKPSKTSAQLNVQGNKADSVTLVLSSDEFVFGLYIIHLLQVIYLSRDIIPRLVGTAPGLQEINGSQKLSLDKFDYFLRHLD